MILSPTTQKTEVEYPFDLYSISYTKLIGLLFIMKYNLNYCINTIPPLSSSFAFQRRFSSDNAKSHKSDYKHSSHHDQGIHCSVMNVKAMRSILQIQKQSILFYLKRKILWLDLTIMKQPEQ